MIAPIIVLLLRVILVIVLYSFLGWMIFTLWKDLKFNSQIIQAQKPPAITLIDRSGETDFGELTFSATDVSIGRDPGNTVCLDDDTISTRHANLVYRNGHWWIEDLASTNGTFLNDERVINPTILIPGDEIQVGKQFFEVNISDRTG